MDEAERLLRKSLDVNGSDDDITIFKCSQVELALVLKAKGDLKEAKRYSDEAKAFFGRWKDHFLGKRLEEHGL